jgi:hypothetical protein
VWNREQTDEQSCGVRYLSVGGLTGPAISRKVGTQAVFHDSSVALQTEHSKLLICRPGAMASVRV